ncbi:MAG: hypothetical protein M1433_03030 [Candidatus Parvarchaeota archaeon]|nr:hypothetical protein [Candidatus Parvarchaeota archaeon]
MGKNIRRGHTGNVRCASCGQLTRRDRAVYLFKNGIKSYYCPDCAKKIHGSRLYKGMPKFVRHRSAPKVKKKFAIYSTSEETAEPNAMQTDYNEPAVKEQNPSEDGAYDQPESDDKENSEENQQ